MALFAYRNELSLFRSPKASRFFPGVNVLTASPSFGPALSVLATSSSVRPSAAGKSLFDTWAAAVNPSGALAAAVVLDLSVEPPLLPQPAIARSMRRRAQEPIDFK